MTRALALVAALLLAGCATNRASEAGLQRGSRVGIVNLLRPQLTHHHVGANSLEHFDKRYAGDAGLPEYVLAELRRGLRPRGYALLLIEPTPELRALASDVLRPLGGAVSDVARSGVQQLARQHKLDHVLFISPICAPAPDARAGELCGHGLYTNRPAGGSLRAAAYFDATVLRLTPQGDLLQPMTTLKPADTMQALPASQNPQDVESLGPEDVGRLAAPVRALASRRMIDSAALVR